MSISRHTGSVAVSSPISSLVAGTGSFVLLPAYDCRRSRARGGYSTRSVAYMHFSRLAMSNFFGIGACCFIAAFVMVGARPTLPVPAATWHFCASCRPFGTGLYGIDVIMPESGDFFDLFVALACVRVAAGVWTGAAAELTIFRGRPRFFFTGSTCCKAFFGFGVCVGDVEIAVCGDSVIFKPSICVFATKSRSSDDV